MRLPAAAAVLCGAFQARRGTVWRYPPRMTRRSPSAAVAAWRSRWDPIVPLLAAEFIVWLGFGGAAAGAADLLHRAGDRPRDARPGHRGLAGRAPGRRAGLRLAGRPDGARAVDGHRAPAGRRSSRSCRWSSPGRWRSSSCAPPSGLATAIYDPAARGYLTDATPPERRARRSACTARPRWAASFSGRPSGRLGADRLGGIGFVFVFGGVAAGLAAIPIALLGA